MAWVGQGSYWIDIKHKICQQGFALICYRCQFVSRWNSLNFWWSAASSMLKSLVTMALKEAMATSAKIGTSEKWKYIAQQHFETSENFEFNG